MPLSNGIKGEAVDMFHSLSKAKRLHHVHWACKDFQDGLNEIRMRHYLISKCRANVRLKLVEVDQHETNKSLDLFEKWIQILSGNSRQIKVKPTWNIVIQPMQFPQHIENHSLDAKPFTARQIEWQGTSSWQDWCNPEWGPPPLSCFLIAEMNQSSIDDLNSDKL